MAATWPSTLPQQFIAGTFQRTYPDNRLRSAVDDGPAKVRRRSSLAPYLITGQMLMSLDQIADLDTFVNSTTAGGSLQFTFPDPLGDGDRIDCRFADRLPMISRSDGTWYWVDVQLEVLPGSIFSPIDLGPALWLDASDETTIDVVDDELRSWDDKSGNDRHASQSDLDARPTWGTHTINSITVPGFDGTKDFMRLASEIDETNGYTIFAVVSGDAFTGDVRVILSSESTGGLTLRCATTGKLQLVRMNEAVLLEEDTLSTSTVYVIAVRTGTDGSELWSNGGDFSPAAATAEDPGFDQPIELIGAQGGPADFFDGAIAEVIVYDKILSDEDVNNVGNYLAGKWGVDWTDIA